MKPDLPSASPLAFHPTILDTPQENRLKLPNGRMVELVSADPEKLEEYCQEKFGRSWPSIRWDAKVDLATRLIAITDRMAPLEALLQKGQPPETLIEAYDDINDALLGAYGDGSLKALMLMGQLSTLGSKFPPLAKPGAGIGNFQAAADMGYIAAYCFLGDHLLKQGRAVEAATAYQQGAQKGCGACLYQLGQLTERGVGGLVQSDRAAFDLYADAINWNYPPAWVAIARLWLRSPRKLPRPEQVVQMLEECVQMECEGAAMVLAEISLCHNRTSYTKRAVMTLYRCAAVEGDIEAQLKLASLLADEGACEMGVEPDYEEASCWYLRVCKSENASPAQAARAHLEIGHLLMEKDKYDQAAHHFSFASCTYLEAVELQHICEKKAANLSRWQQHYADE
ncbi:sel1 repeat family protein [Pseudomonas putida]|uniref:sel1 repeat family protein n=1 Tax=Pseudomonas putida TaxID=303 RepID=UPI0018D7C475|nr:sel1 repeat family protein [Pseudomonas putida]MBH3389421.1 sel1 repeat family protein [Pseudomonas putida]